MGLETGTGIGDLVPTNPLSTDAVSSGDDHIRLIKTVMQSITFLKNIVTFTASGTWTKTVNVKKILIVCIGGGSGGCGTPAAGFGGGGGASGATAIKWLDVAAITTAGIAIGAGGAGGALGGNIGLVGGDTTFHANAAFHCIGKGGGVGANYNVGADPSPIASSQGDIIFTGSFGQTGDPPATTSNGGQGGGFGGGRTGQGGIATSGGGGGGGPATTAAGFVGQPGGAGYCIIFEFGW